MHHCRCHQRHNIGDLPWSCYLHEPPGKKKREKKLSEKTQRCWFMVGALSHRISNLRYCIKCPVPVIGDHTSPLKWRHHRHNRHHLRRRTLWQSPSFYVIKINFPVGSGKIIFWILTCMNKQGILDFQIPRSILIRNIGHRFPYSGARLRTIYTNCGARFPEWHQ